MAGALATAAVEIIAELDRFEPELRRKLISAVQSAADDAEREFRKQGNRNGKTFADATAKAAASNGQKFQQAGQRAGASFGDGLTRAARSSASDAGDQSGSFFSRAFETAASRAVGVGLLRVFGGATAGLVTALSPVSTLVGGAAAAVVALTGTLVQAAGAGIALGGVLGSLGLAAAVVKVGSAGLSDALSAQAAALAELSAEGEVSTATQEKLAAAMKGLAPAAQQVVQALGAQAGAWAALRRAVQQELFQDVGAEIQRLASTYLPILSTQLRDAAGTVNSFIREFAQFLTSGDRASRINAILTQLNSILASLLPALVPITNAFLTLFQASLPFAQQLAEAIGRIGERFSTWAAGLVESGRFQEFMEGAFDAASSLFQIIGSLGSILGSVFSAGAEAGVGLLQNLAGILAAFDQFLASAEGQSALASFFGLISSAGAILGDVIGALAPAMAGLSAVFSALQGPVRALGAALGPVIAQLFITLGDALTQLAPVLAQLVVGLTPLITALGGGLVAVLQAVLTAILPLLPVLAQFVTAIAANIVPVLGQLVPVILTLVEAFGQILLALVPLLPALLPLIPPLAQLSVSFAQILVALAPLIVAVAQLAAGLLTGLTPALAAIVGFVAGAVSAFAQLVGQVAAVVGAIAGFVADIISRFSALHSQGSGLINALVGAIVGAVGGLVGPVVGFFTSMVSQALGVLSGFVESSRDRAARVASAILGAIRSGLSGLAGVFRAPFDAARGAVASALEGILSTVQGFVSRIAGAIAQISSAISRIPRPSFPGLPGINIPGFADGGLQRTPTLATIAEEGPEVIIPLTKPRRRDELLEKYFGGWEGQQAWGGGRGYGGKTTQINVPINAGTVVGADDLVQMVGEEIDRRLGRRIGIETSRGKV